MIVAADFYYMRASKCDTFYVGAKNIFVNNLLLPIIFRNFAAETQLLTLAELETRLFDKL